jgi:hypothetical protein
MRRRSVGIFFIFVGVVQIARVESVERDDERAFRMRLRFLGREKEGAE